MRTEKTLPDARHRPHQAGNLPAWAALAGAAAALAAAVTVALVSRGQVADLRAEKAGLEQRLAELETSRAAAAAEGASLATRLKAAEDRAAALEARVLGEDRVRELAQAAVREELARRAPPRPGPGGPGAGPGRDLERRGDEIAEIREKVRRGEMTEEQGREAIAAKIREGIRTFMGPRAAERMDQAREEREKNLTPEQKKQADQARGAILDGIAEWMEIQKKVREGKMTEEEGREAMRKLWQRGGEELRKMREQGQQMPEPKEEF